jgi:hypothetical protein
MAQKGKCVVLMPRLGGLLALKKPAFLLLNNRLEGNAPSTIEVGDQVCRATVRVRNYFAHRSGDAEESTDRAEHDRALPEQDPY